MGDSGPMVRLGRRLRAAFGRASTAVAPSGAEETAVYGPYELRSTVLHGGTRSEGRVGRLFVAGAEVPRPSVGSTIDVPEGDGVVRLTYHGEERPHLWTTSGWSSANLPD